VTVAYLGMGANLGDRLANLQTAVDLLGEEPGVRVVASSRVWETEPVGGPDQPDYLNAVIRIETELEPKELLGACMRVEKGLGRVRCVRWGPRPLDVDVLMFDDVVSNDPTLTLPHPRMLQRAFVLVPLLELDPDPVLANGRRVLDATVDVEGVRPFASPLRLPEG
jgi:2-amino-4-hydroxy-6-hydroxymethyldihydropteridine diphosphokinase